MPIGVLRSPRCSGPSIAPSATACSTLCGALIANDVKASRALLFEIAILTGPHFQYEEEALYPSLVQLFGVEYVDRLYADHDGAIAAVARLAEIVQTESLSREEIAEAVRLARAILPHVSDCDGLSIMVEVLEDAEIDQFLEAHERTLAQGLDLLTWAVGPRLTSTRLNGTT